MMKLGKVTLWCLAIGAILISLACSTQQTSTPIGPTSTPMSPALTPTVADCLSSETAELIWLQLSHVEPTQMAPGGEIKVIGSGGYLRCEQGGYIHRNESARPFQLYLDDQPVSTTVCYVNHCEVKFAVPSDMSPGTHIISVEGGSTITIQVTGH